MGAGVKKRDEGSSKRGLKSDELGKRLTAQPWCVLVSESRQPNNG